jgi:hypothetical protein
LIITSCVGDVSPDEILASIRALRTDPRYRPEYHGVCDATNATFAFGANEARLLAREIGGGTDRSKGKWAFLIDEPRSTALVLVFGSARDPATPVRVFVTASAASEWLGIEVSESDLAALRAQAARTG